MKTSDVLPYFNNSIRELADALGITREAVYQWGDLVPQLRAYQIRELISERAQVIGSPLESVHRGIQAPLDDPASQAAE